MEERLPQDSEASDDIESEDEDLFQAVLTELRKPQKGSGNLGALLTVLAVAFMVLRVTVGGDSVPGLVALMFVLLLHEAGHALAMRAVGYADIKIFFIPFFGAATTALPRNVVAWKQVVVLLAGPLPGLLLGIALYQSSHVSASFLSVSIASMLIGINAFNLLPVEPLDGGRLLGLVLFAGQPKLRVAYSVLASFGFLFLLGLPASVTIGLGFALIAFQRIRYRAASIATEVRRETKFDYSTAPDDIAQIDTALLRPLFYSTDDAIVRSSAHRSERNPAMSRALHMRLALEFLRAKRLSLALAIPIALALVLYTVFFCGAIYAQMSQTAATAPSIGMKPDT